MSISSLSGASPGAINIRESRGFSDQLTMTFAFLRQNFRQLGRSVMVITGPVILLGGVLVTILFSIPSRGSSILEESAGRFLLLFIVIILFIFGWLLLTAVVNSYVFLYLERKGEEIEGISVRDVWQATKENLGRVISTAFGLGGVWIGFNIVSGILGIIPLIGILASFGSFFLILYFVVALMPIYTVRLREDIGIFDAISRCRELIRDNWWMTFGLLVVTGGICTLLFYAVAGAAYLIGKGLIHLVATSTATLLQSLLFQVLVLPVVMAGMILYIIPTLAGVLQYFNLLEKLEGVGVLERIEKLGEDDVPSFDSSTS